MNRQDFLQEMQSFTQTAEATLNLLEQDPLSNRHRFEMFSERMLTIRGTADQLKLAGISEIAALGEEISLKALSATRNTQVRKCMGALWDSLTTIQFLLKNDRAQTTEEEAILISRLKKTLDALGGERERVAASEIDALFNSYQPDSVTKPKK